MKFDTTGRKSAGGTFRAVIQTCPPKCKPSAKGTPIFGLDAARLDRARSRTCATFAATASNGRCGTHRADQHQHHHPARRCVFLVLAGKSCRIRRSPENCSVGKWFRVFSVCALECLEIFGDPIHFQVFDPIVAALGLKIDGGAGIKAAEIHSLQKFDFFSSLGPPIAMYAGAPHQRYGSFGAMTTRDLKSRGLESSHIARHRTLSPRWTPKTGQ